MPAQNEQFDMIPAKRRALILDHIKQKGSASVNELSEIIGSSVSTIRRDLDELSRLQLIQRSHGGATLPSFQSTTFEPDREISSRTGSLRKRAIGRLAAQRIRNGQSVIFDSSSTVFEAAFALVKQNVGMTAITNDIRTAELMAGASNIRVITLGGTIRPGSLTLLGEPGISFLDKLHADVALIGIQAISGSRFCDSSIEVSMMKRQMVKASACSIVLADSAKFSTTAFCDACDISEIDEIITDNKISEEHRLYLENAGVRFSLAEVDAG